MAQSKYKSEFEKIFTEKIKREGADKLLEYIKSTDFFDAPASTKFHGNFRGGLVEHSVKVYHRFIKMIDCEFGPEWFKKPENTESAAVIALLHDICKANCYKTEMRNVKEGDKWVQKPYYAFDDPLPYGHGEKSVYMIGGYMKLSREEAMAINWHMGGFDPRNSIDRGNNMFKAYQQFPIALVFHCADYLASYLDEEVRK